LRKQLVSGKKLLLFVDTGDNCRCPLAIGYLSKLLAQKNIDYLDLRHMGVMTPNDLLPTPEVVQLLKEEGVDIRYHRSRPVNDELIRQADLVLGFTAIHVQTCLRRVPESKGKVFLLKQYVGLAHTGDQIHDPMGSTMEIFKKYFSDIKLSLHKLVEMEFITSPPEPKEVVIAPSVSKPRPMATGEDEEPHHRRTRKPEAEAEQETAARARAKAAPADKHDAPEAAAAGKKKPAKPSKSKETPAKSTEAAVKPKSTAAGKASKAKPDNAKAKATELKSAAGKPAKAPAIKAGKGAEKAGPKTAGSASGQKSKPAAKAKAAEPKPAKAEKAAKPAAKPAKKTAAPSKGAATKPAGKQSKSKK
jgi:protein-tyrosine phosphatase